MKKANINLLPTSNRFETSRIHWARQLKSVAFIAVTVWVVVVGATFAFKLYFSSQTKKVVQEINQIEAGLEELTPQAMLQQALRLRIKTATDLIENRYSSSESFERFLTILPENTSLGNISLRANNVDINIIIDSLEGLREFEEMVEEAKGGEFYEEFRISSISQQDNQWVVNLEIVEFPLAKK